MWPAYPAKQDLIFIQRPHGVIIIDPIDRQRGANDPRRQSVDADSERRQGQRQGAGHHDQGALRGVVDRAVHLGLKAVGGANQDDCPSPRAAVAGERLGKEIYRSHVERECLFPDRRSDFQKREIEKAARAQNQQIDLTLPIKGERGQLAGSFRISQINVKIRRVRRSLGRTQALPMRKDMSARLPQRQGAR